MRLRSHLQQLDGMLNEVKPVGRKLDFLVQEMNRETNTIGSKANDVSMAQIVVNIKSEIGKNPRTDSEYRVSLQYIEE